MIENGAPNWDAVAAIAAALTFVVTLYFFWRGGARSIVTVGIESIEGKIEGSEISASRITLKNRGSHISDFSIRINRVYDLKCAVVDEAKTIDEKAIKLDSEDTDLVISVPDLPSGEHLIINIFSRFGIRSYALKGGSSKFILKSPTDFYTRRLNIAAAGIFAVSVIFGVAG